MCATALTAQLSLALCYWWGGGGWYYLQPRSWGVGSSWTWNPCPTACPGQGSASDTCVQHSQYLPSSAAQPQMCWSAANWDLCRFMPVLCNKKKTSCPWCAPCKGLCPTPTSQSNCKTKLWTPWESGAKPIVVDWGQIKSKPQRHHHPAGHSCCSTCPGTTARHRTALSSVTCQSMLGAVLQFLLHLTQSCSVRAARRDSRSHLLRGTDTQEIALWRKQRVSWTGCAQLQECKLSRGILTLSPSAPLYIYIN